MKNDKDRVHNLWAQYRQVKMLEAEQATKILRKLLDKQLRHPMEHGRTWSGTMRGQQSFPVIPQMIPKSDEATFLREQFRKHNKALMVIVDDLPQELQEANEALDRVYSEVVALLRKGITVSLYEDDRLVGCIRPTLSGSMVNKD